VDDKVKKLLNKLADEKFEYGKNDCFTYTARLVHTYHGIDYRHAHKYQGEKQALAYMAQHGGIEAMITGTLGYPLKSPLDCQDGDVVTAEVSKDQIALGFVYNDRANFKTEKRAVAVPLKRCRTGWRVK